jgi:asparagine N-glycosylation enzyme membrane subunit Stt3
MTFTEGPVHERSDVFIEPPAVAVVETPLVEAPLAQVPVVQVTVPAAPTVTGQVRTAYASRFAPDALIAALVGLVLLVVGLIAIVRGGFDGPMSDPVVSVIGFTHTTSLGLIEITIGLCLLLSGAARSRTGEVFFGAILGIGAFVGAVQTDSFKKSLALESGLAWLAVFGAIVVVLAALVMPRFARNSTTISNV